MKDKAVKIDLKAAELPKTGSSLQELENLQYEYAGKQKIPYLLEEFKLEIK